MRFWRGAILADNRSAIPTRPRFNPMAEQSEEVSVQNEDTLEQALQSLEPSVLVRLLAKVLTASTMGELTSMFSSSLQEEEETPAEKKDAIVENAPHSTFPTCEKESYNKRAKPTN